MMSTLGFITYWIVILGLIVFGFEIFTLRSEVKEIQRIHRVAYTGVKNELFPEDQESENV